MGSKKIRVIQTINYIESYEHANEICRLILNSYLDGIRINLCKYRKTDVQKVIKHFISIFNEHNIQNIYLDIPYPIDKARIYGIVEGRKDIRKNQEYIIVKGNSARTIFNYKNNQIYINCNRVEVKRDLIFYGDGEGAFKVIDIDSEKIRCVALNNFYVINGKSISCGYFIQEKNQLVDILESINDMKVSLLIPFVESANQIREIRRYPLKNVSLIAKIETACGMENIENISKEVEGILFGRGDLALHSNLKNLLQDLQAAVEKVRGKKLIFCTGILQNFKETYIPNRAELFDLLLLKKLCADEIVLSGTADYSLNNIYDLYSNNLRIINKRVEFIKNVW